MFFRIALPYPPAIVQRFDPAVCPACSQRRLRWRARLPIPHLPRRTAHPPKPGFTIVLHGRLQRSSTFARYVNYRGRMVAPLDLRSHHVKTLSVVVVLLLSMASRSSGQIRGFGFVQGTIVDEKG